jgi:hypothetical protein
MTRNIRPPLDQVVIEIAAAKLTLVDPDHDVIAGQAIFQRLGLKCDAVLLANLVTVVTVNENPIPDRQRISAAVALDISFKLFEFVRRQRRYESKTTQVAHDPENTPLAF